MKIKSIAKHAIHTADTTKLSGVLRRSSLALALSVIGMQMVNTAQAAYNEAGTPVGDLSIYTAANPGGANVMLMLDVSGSMGMFPQTNFTIQGNRVVAVDSIFDDSVNGVSCVNNGRTKTVTYYGGGSDTYKIWEDDHGLGRFDESITIDGETINYSMQGCTQGSWGGVNNIVLGTYRYKATNGYFYDENYTRKFSENPNGDYFQLIDENSSNNGKFYDIDATYIGSSTKIYDSSKYKRYSLYTGSTSNTWKLTNPSKWEWDSTNRLWKAKSNTVTLPDGRLDRLSRLKRALIKSLGTFTKSDIDAMPPGSKSGYGIAPDGREVTVGDYRISSKNLVGLGQFSSNDNNGNRTGVNGQILMPSKELTDEHRKNLIKTIATFYASGGTPSANAYAETGAYMLGTTTKDKAEVVFTNGTVRSLGGFKYPVSSYAVSSDIKNNSNYIKPGQEAEYQCYGKGIYFLTDGQPNSTYNQTIDLMKATLENTGKSLGTKGLSEQGVSYTNNSGWDLIGKYSQSLRSTDKYEDIKTATVGFGKPFLELAKAKRISITNDEGNIEKIIDCNAEKDLEDNPLSIGQDAKNLCNWGRKENYTNGKVTPTDKKWGGGGFTAARTSKDIEESLLEFIQAGSPDVDALPSGTISVPDDPYRGNRITAFAYLPMLQPKLDGNPSIWQGNVKKYATQDGTLYGKSNKRLYKKASLTDSGELDDATADLWSPSPILTAGNSNVHIGGFYANLLAPESSKVGSTRKVYVESYTGGGNNLIEISVNSNGKTKNFPKISDIVYGTNGTQLLRSKRKMLNFMGYTIQPDGNANNIDTTYIANLDMKQFLPSSPVRHLGGVIHSNPALVSYSAGVDDLGNVKTEEQDRDDYLLFGSMDGTLHLVDVDTGKEKWAIILQAMFQSQSDALVQGSKGSLKFGIDAPWFVTSSYDYNDDSNGNEKVELDSTANLPMMAYGGFRMGGRGLYAIDLKKVNKPKVQFSITPSISDSSKVVLHKDGTEINNTDYSDMGQIWSKVTMGRLYNNTDKPDTDVIVFGGGYDTAYEDPSFVPSTAAKGRTVYIVNAKTGKKIWAWDGKTKDGKEYLHSVVGGITTLDRNNDGAFDYLYFADLGGNVFRADFINENNKKLKNIRVTRIFGASDELPVSSKHLAYRFYNRPVVSFYKTPGRKLFAMINIASGNRSSPLSKERSDNKYANKVYGIIDNEITTGSLLDTNNIGKVAETSDIVESKLTELSGNILKNTTAVDDSNKNISKLCSPLLDNDGNAQTNASGGFIYSERCKKKVALVSDMISNNTKGWYYSLTRFDGFEGIKNIKAVGNYTVIGGYLYMTAYDSNMKFKNVDQCSADVKGGSENQLYCLPYGVCMDDTSITGTGGFSPATKGIQELTIGAVNEDNTNIKTLIGTHTLKERQVGAVDFDDSNNGKPKGNLITDACQGGKCVDDYDESTLEDGDGTMADMLFTERYMMTPHQWFEVNE